jgi:hypothetical protein
MCVAIQKLLSWAASTCSWLRSSNVCNFPHDQNQRHAEEISAAHVPVMEKHKRLTATQTWQLLHDLNTLFESSNKKIAVAVVGIIYSRQPLRGVSQSGIFRVYCWTSADLQMKSYIELSYSQNQHLYSLQSHTATLRGRTKKQRFHGFLVYL